jgi:hypothetical protein
MVQAFSSHASDSPSFSPTDLEAMRAAVRAARTEDRGRNRRGSNRHKYPAAQLVAFHDEAQVPTTALFEGVRCHDLSTSGISFFLPDPPAFEYCTVVLGRPPALIYVKARVMHYSPYAGRAREWLIGCQFVCRVNVSS